MPLTVLAIADEVSPLLYDHFDARRWKGIDCVVSCGDLPPGYLDFIGTNLSVPVLYVRGNHDGAHPRSEYEVGQDLHGTIVEFRGVRFAGFEGCKRYNHGFCQLTEQQMRRVARTSRVKALRHGAPDVIVTHAPPAGHHDGKDRCHQGFQIFTDLIDLWKPSYFLHGHVHAYDRSPDVSMVGETTIVNAYPFQLVQVATREERALSQAPAGPQPRLVSATQWSRPFRRLGRATSR